MRPLHTLARLALLAAALLLTGCQSSQQGYEDPLEATPQPKLPPPPSQIIVRYPHVARNGVSPLQEAAPPENYSDFRNSLDYRLTFRTWKDDSLLRSPGKKRVVIDLANQRGQCLVNEQVAMDFPVCTGMQTHLTPTGIFRISEKDANHRSNIYHCAMPYFMRLTNGGIGLHIGDVYRVPASHGCIRITRDACIDLFHHLPSGTEVVIN